VSKEKEGKQEGEAPPHPGLEALCGEKAGQSDQQIATSICAGPKEGRPLPPSTGGSERAGLTHSEVHGVPLAQGAQAV
jgi:hypothetical protein